MKERRKTIPPRPENATPNYLKMLKSAVGGKDLSRMAMPVEFNEPLSMLQRQTEELEYAHLLDLASFEKDPNRRMAFVCVFAISGYSTIGSRPTKPFNPLLGETFECDRRADRGWCSLAEQVSHHPPGSALHVEGEAWTLEQQYLMESKLKGTSICLSPIGATTIRFNDGDCYTYGKVPTMTSLDSILNWNSTKNGQNSSTTTTECIGKLEVKNVGNEAKATIIFHPDKKGMPQRMVNGTIFDGKGNEIYSLEAIWDKWARLSRMDGRAQNSTEFENVWAVDELPVNSHQMHNFTKFAIELNEEEAGVAPTDSRCRPDQRLCEMGEFGAANRVKKCLEEAQRLRLKESQKRGKEHQPLWFEPSKSNQNGKSNQNNLIFTGDYWKAKEAKSWEICPEIFAV